jgi:hypothetical protein
LKEQFGGVPISKQNLSDWRQGGFARWQAQRELLTQARDMAENASELNSAADGRLTDHLATVLAARYAALLSGWSGEMSEGMREQLKSLHGLCRAVVVLRRGDYHCTRLRLEEERAELAREKTQEEMLGYFEKWVENCKVQAVLAESEPDAPSGGGPSHQPKAKGRRQKAKGSSRRSPSRTGHQPRAEDPSGRATKPDEYDGRLHQLFGLPAKPVLSEAPSEGAPMQDAEVVQNPSESRSVKHSQGSDGGTVALQRLDAALTENTEPEVSEAEKTRYFMEVMFGMQPKTHPEPPAKPVLPSDTPSSPSGVAPSPNAEGGMQKSEPDGLPEAEKLSLLTPALSSFSEEREKTLPASSHEPTSGGIESNQVEIKSENAPSGGAPEAKAESEDENDSPRPFPRPVAGPNSREPVSRPSRRILPVPDGPRRTLRDGYI